MVSYLTEELVRAGHDVTLFASGDSQTSAKLVPMVEHSLRLDPDSIDQLAHHILMIERIRQVARSFDILHFHIDYLHYPMSRQLGVPQITTLHGRLDIKDLVPLYDRADAQGALVARLQPGVLATVKHCSGTWCHISGTGFDGWMVQERLWGVYQNEKVD